MMIGVFAVTIGDIDRTPGQMAGIDGLWHAQAP